MTSPEEPQEQPSPENPQVPPVSEAEQDEQESDESALIPALLLIYAVYLMWRGSHDRVALGWRQVASALQLRNLIGAQLTQLASRAVLRQAERSGRAGDELWEHMRVGVDAGVEAGIRVVAEALIWTDRQSAGADPQTRDAAGKGVPTGQNPPDLLANLVAGAVVNAAVLAVAKAAGWRHKFWRSRMDNRVRPAHVEMHGQLRRIDETFEAPDGSKLRYPRDPLAPMDLTANCRCKAVPVRR